MELRVWSSSSDDADGFDIRPMMADDYDEVAALWQNTEGIGLDEHVDTREGIAGYLARHPGLSFVALLECGDESPHSQKRIVGAVLCGDDGRRGYLHHLAVAAAWRRNGIGRALVEACLKRLASVGIPKCNIFLLADNELGKTFWKHNGWNERNDLKVLQKETPS
jgi:N-acetylglutamate synthase